MNFNELAPQEQRMLIAKDSIKWLDAQKINIKKAIYFRINTYKSEKDDLQIDMQLNKAINNGKNIVCDVCVKGGLLFSHIMYNNNVTIAEATAPEGTSSALWDDDVQSRLKDIFSPLQMDMMETAFEGKVVNDSGWILEEWIGDDLVPTTLGAKCILFGDEIDNPEERYRAIIQNIIDNNGEFVVDEISDKKAKKYRDDFLNGDDSGLEENEIEWDEEMEVGEGEEF